MQLGLGIQSISTHAAKRIYEMGGTIKSGRVGGEKHYSSHSPGVAFEVIPLKGK